jgi:probable rRNA maturation factor
MRLVILKDNRLRLPRARINRLFEIVCDDEAEPGWQSQVDLIITSDTRVRSLNKDFRSKDSATDVLSFPLDDPSEPDSVFGEIYIAEETALRQAGEYGGSFSDELLRLFCHGLLHLFGYDHMNTIDETEMMRHQQMYLHRIGVDFE